MSTCVENPMVTGAGYHKPTFWECDGCGGLMDWDEVQYQVGLQNLCWECMDRHNEDKKLEEQND